MNDEYSVGAFSVTSLFEALSNCYCQSEQVARQARAIYLSNYLSALEAKSIVVENRYIDGDYLEDFSSYYVRCFQDYNRRCKRLHFFYIDFDEKKLRKYIIEGTVEELKALNDHYLGFVVVRPLPDAIIGRTILKTYPSDSDRRNYTVTKSYSANLFGISLTVISLAFQEQDTVLAACATVALWSAFQMTSHLFGGLAPRPAEITRIANGVVAQARPIPSHGLEIRQVIHAIRSLGLEPEIIRASPDVPLISIAYSYLKMKLPVLLVISIEGKADWHAITIAGYSIRKERKNQQEVASGEKSIPMVGLRIDEFYAHDDQVGPFSRLKVKPGNASAPVLFEGSWKDSQTQKILTLTPEFIIIPVYNKIRVSSIHVSKWLERFSQLLSFLLTDANELEWDLYLVEINKLKATIKKDSIPLDDLERFLISQQPRFIWRAICRFKSNPLVEFFADATDMERSFPIYEQVWHDSGFRNIVKEVLQKTQIKNLFIEMLEKRFYDFLIR